MAFDVPERFLGRIHGPGLSSRRNHDARRTAPALDSACALVMQEPSASTFRIAENSSKALAGNAVPIVHTERAFGPTARQAKKLSRGLAREDHNARLRLPRGQE